MLWVLFSQTNFIKVHALCFLQWLSLDRSTEAYFWKLGRAATLMLWADGNFLPQTQNFLLWADFHLVTETALAMRGLVIHTLWISVCFYPNQSLFKSSGFLFLFFFWWLIMFHSALGIHRLLLHIPTSTWRATALYTAGCPPTPRAQSTSSMWFLFLFFLTLSKA